MGTDGEGSWQSLLHGVPWFAACTDEQLSQMARVAERLRIQSGEVILREGRLGRELFVILEGTATVTRAGRVVNILHVGDYFGELAAIESVPRSATVHATTDLDVLIVGPREFETMMDIPGFRNALLDRYESAHPRGGRQVGGIRGAGGPRAGCARRGHRVRLIERQSGAAACCASRCNPIARADSSPRRRSTATRSPSAAGRR